MFPGSKLCKDSDCKFDKNNIENSFAEPRYLFGELSKKELIIAQRKALMAFYFRPSIFFRLIKFIKKEPVISFFERLFKKVNIK